MEWKEVVRGEEREARPTVVLNVGACVAHHLASHTISSLPPTDSFCSCPPRNRPASIGRRRRRRSRNRLTFGRRKIISGKAFIRDRATDRRDRALVCASRHLSILTDLELIAPSINVASTTSRSSDHWHFVVCSGFQGLGGDYCLMAAQSVIVEEYAV